MDSTITRSRAGVGLLLVAAAALAATGAFAIVQSLAGAFLPHDVAWLGMTAGDLLPYLGGRIVAFMFHDRVAFGGTLLAVGTLYGWLARGPLARRERWAWWALVASGSIGFLSFLAYLGTGYIDTWHGLATLLLLPVFVAGLAVTWERGFAGRPIRGPWLVDAARRHRDRRLVGPAVTALACVGMVVAGLTILGVGATMVFVPQDLAFIGAQRCAIAAISDRLVPLIAHDRTGFGGGLLATGVAATAIALFGPPTASRWLALAIAGTLGFAAAIGVHLAIGYTEVTHLGPAVLGALVLLAGLVISRAMGQSSSWFAEPVGSPSAGRGSSPGA